MFQIKARGARIDQLEPMNRAFRLALIAASAGLLAASAARAEPPDVAFGRRLAERNCGACHAIGDGASPNPRSPPFRDLYRRYPPAGLDALLSEGMLAPEVRPEEGGGRRHPWMPQVRLGPDEVAALKAYLHSLEPAYLHRGRRTGT